MNLKNYAKKVLLHAAEAINTAKCTQVNKEQITVCDKMNW